MAKLTNAALKRLIQKSGRHADGGGLYFRVLGAGRAYWAFRYRVDGKAREMSLGTYPEVTLAEARDRHGAERTKVRTYKRDPLAEKRAAKQDHATPTFGAVADDHLAAHQPTRKNEGHRRQWFVALTRYCAPIRDMPVDAIDTEAVLSVLKPLWTRAPDTGSRLRGMIEKVLDAARARGHIDPDRANPARWRGHLENLLPHPDKIGNHGHHAAMPYAYLPAFVAKLKDAEGIAVNALMLAILTAARSVEVIGATCDEIDLDAKLWVVPAERMKMRVEHHVPLSGGSRSPARPTSGAPPEADACVPRPAARQAAQRPGARSDDAADGRERLHGARIPQHVPRLGRR
jgi:hypothetical protein